jgi:chromosome partitioning protein
MEMQKHLRANKQMSENSNELLWKDAKVLIVDADPQGTARDWHEEGGHKLIDLIVLDRKQTLHNLGKMDLDYDYIFIDTPGRVSEISTTAVVISDVVLVPIQPSPYDIWAAADTLEVVKQRQEITNGIQPIGRFVLNRCIPNTNIEKDAKEYLHKSAFPHFNTCIFQRVVYAESGAQGKTVFECNNRLAMDSIILLGTEIREAIENA